MSGYFKTIADLERATYGLGSDNLMKSEGITSGIVGEHFSATAASNPALYNLIYGQKVWSMINREINALSILPKKPWKSSGWRILKERAVGGGLDTFAANPDKLGGTAENAALSDITNVKPEYSVLNVTPKTVAHTFEISEIAQLMAGLDDGIGDLIANYREEVGITHAEVMNRQILLDLTTNQDGLRHTSLSDAERDRNLTSLYKIVSTFDELDNSGSELFTNSLDIYGDTRTSASDPHLESYIDTNP